VQDSLAPAAFSEPAAIQGGQPPASAEGNEADMAPPPGEARLESNQLDGLMGEAAGG